MPFPNTPTVLTEIFDKVLIANRGEIAVRLIRGCKKLGYSTVAVYSEADQHALHVRMADQAVAIGAAPAKESYLDMNKIIAAAKSAGANAIHPGYGFLSERSDFAQAVLDAGLVFIGPDPAAIEAMGNKSASKIRMIAAGVPCIPGYQGADQSDATLTAEALRIGFPVMIKASSGGGGRGMRLVHHAGELEVQIQSARNEAVNAFGDGQLLIEKAIQNGRHVEIQVFGDRQGNVVHFGERDCSIQRRNQKVVEEAPSPAVDEKLRERMGAAAVAAARAVNYVGAGTVEFLLADGNSFYFLEMNTRLQVEHPVTELVYDVDLVEWQLRVAQGESLPWSQEQILARRKGWAIEARLCTEDPAQQFLPQSGKLLAWQAPEGRVDHGLEEGAQISSFYDSMQAKLIAYGESREEARRNLLQMLDATVLLGVHSNRDFLRKLIAHSQFAAGKFSTEFIAEHFPADQLAADNQPHLCHLALAASLFYVQQAERLRIDASLNAELMQWQSSAPATVPLVLKFRGKTVSLFVTPMSRTTYQVDTPQGSTQLELKVVSDIQVMIRADGVSSYAQKAQAGSNLWLSNAGLTLCYEDMTFAPPETKQTGADGRLQAPMDGKLMQVLVKVGESVTKGQKLAVLEAMKMEFSIVSSVDGIVKEVCCPEGTQVKVRQLLFVI